jgi:TRAP-type transport system periplasmic protein
MRLVARSCLAFALLAAAAVQAAEPHALRLGLFVPTTQVHVRDALLPWMERVNELLEPEGYVIKLYPGGALGRTAALQGRLLHTGVLDITWYLPGYTPGRYPEIELMELPLLDDDPETLTQAFWRMYERGYLPSLDDVQALALSVSPAYHAHLTFHIDSLADIAGRKIRVNDVSESQIVQAMGGTPVAGIGANELAETLSRGLVDGTLFSWHSMGTMGVDRVTYVHIDTPLTFTPSILAMNRRTYESLPPRVQEILISTSGESLSLDYTRSMLRGAQAAIERARADERHTFYVPSETDRRLIEDAFESMRQRWHGGDAERLALIAAMEEVLAEIDAERRTSADARH